MRIWFGSIVIAYKTYPNRILILENRKSGKITTPSGAVQGGETLQEAAARELKEELGWVVSPKRFQVTQIMQEFVYGPQKKERAGDKGINQVLLLDANHLPEPQETNDAKNTTWLSLEDAKRKISFDDLRDIVEEASKLLPHQGDLERR